MRPADYPTAWSHPPTRRSWFYHLITTGLRFLGWIAVWISSLGFLVSFLSPVYSFLFIPALIYSAFRAVLQLAYIRPSLYIRRVLQQYPWQLLTGVPRGRNKHPAVQEDEMWLELPNPERPDERIPLLFLSGMRTFWWMRRFGTARTKPELKAQIEPLWFAGDPRFIAVIAAGSRSGTAPRRLHLLYQLTATGRRGVAPIDWDAGPAALDRARRSGAHVPAPVSPHPHVHPH
ncbi:hypothetical protein [Streptomyces sp. NBC_00198]|uniref:hypothetical protein n=1 Tax=Streptomyces sp. NBC_00198 TaxID=2975677 RepID=UPI002252C664|nr:hypothetical protein [Streptomyces sp. NBC_00198]MCX5283652.1 hypothetical protein [Streptomyces sp. NBC_00198]